MQYYFKPSCKISVNPVNQFLQNYISKFILLCRNRQTAQIQTSGATIYRYTIVVFLLWIAKITKTKITTFVFLELTAHTFKYIVCSIGKLYTYGEVPPIKKTFADVNAGCHILTSIISY